MRTKMGAANILRKRFRMHWDAQIFQFLSTPASVGFESLNPSSILIDRNKQKVNKKK